MARKRKASASQILKWLRCPRSWYYRYVEKIQEPQTIPLVRGVLVHSVIEQMFDLDLKGAKITKRNYKEKLPEAIDGLFNQLLDSDTVTFGRPEPSPHAKFINLSGDDAEDEIELTRLMLRNFIDQYMRELEQWVIKKDSFPKAFRESAPTFRELHIEFDNFQAYLDQVYDINGSIIIADLKTSTLTTGKVPSTSRYIPAGITGVNDEYVLQLFMYAWAYWKKYGVMADWLSLKYVKYGYEFTIPFKFMDREAIFEAIELLIDTFTEATQSKNIDDYPMNHDGSFVMFKEWNIHNTFCSAKTTRFSDRGFCYYDRFCNECLGDVETIEEVEAECVIELDDTEMKIPAWLASKKGLGKPKYQGVISRETEKAYLLKIVGVADEIWVPKSQVS